MPRRDDPQPGLGRAIRTFRLRRRLSQDALGKRSSIHPTWISHLESGRINPTWGNMRRISDGLDVTLGELADKAMEYEDRSYVGRSPDPPAPPDMAKALADLAERFLAFREDWNGFPDVEALYDRFDQFHREFKDTLR